MKFVRQSFFENANKPGKWLAYKVRKEKVKSWITTLKDEKGEQQSQETVKKIIEDFYRNLYRKKDIQGRMQMQYLKKYNRIRWDEEQKKTLNELIAIYEIIEAIKIQKSGKAPGPDGIPAEYYKKWEDTLFIPYKRVLESIIEGGKVPCSWREAYITLIHKEKMD